MAGEMSIGKLFVELLVNDAKFGPALKGATAELNKLAAEAKRSADTAAAAVKPLATAFTVVTAAEKQHIAAIVASQAAETQRAAALGITTGQLRQVDAALKAQTATTAAATTAVKGHTTALGAATQSTGELRGAATNLRFQIFDVVQQVSAGQNPLMILNQQGFQIAQVFTQGAGVMATFTAALGPLGGLFTAAVAAAGPLLVIIAALVTVYAVFSNASMDIEERTTGAADAAVAAAKKIRGTEADIEAGRKAWEKFRDTVESLSIELAKVDGDLTKTEAKTIERVAKVREEHTAAIRQSGREYAAALTELQAAEATYYNPESLIEAKVAAAKAIDGLTEKTKKAKTVLDAQKGALDDAIGGVLKLAAAEEAADEDKGGKKGKADATREQADALRDYAAAMKDLAKVSEDASDKASLTAFEDLGGSSKTERTFAKAAEKARQDAEKSVAAAESALAEALAAAKVVGGEAGEQMAEGARTAFATANDVFLAELIQAQDAATRTALETQKAAAAKRLDADVANVSLRVGTEEDFADTLGSIREEYLARYGELQRVEVDYARLTGDEKLAIEQKIQGELTDLRDKAAEAELARSKEIAKKYGAEAKDIFAMTKQTVSDLYSYQTDQIAATTELFAADTAAREKMAEGEALDAQERAALLTYTEKQQLEKRYEEQKKAALATFYAQQALAVTTIAINTAMAVSQALANIPPPASYVAAGVMAGLGVVQAGLVLAQAPPEFHGGGVVAESDRRRSPGNSTDRAVTTELEVGEGVLVSRTVQALGGSKGLARLNVDPVAAISSIAARVSPTSGLSRTSAARFDSRSMSSTQPPPFAAGGAPGATGGSGAAQAAAQRPLVVVSKIGERTFDTVMADGLLGRRLPKVRAHMQRLTGVTVGLEG